MSKLNRRTFMLQATAGTSVLVMQRAAAADPILSESDPQAVTLGYKADSSKVDAVKYPQHESKVPQECGGCQLYEAIAGSLEPYGHCSLFEGKRVSVKGWCSAWA
jgi:hypothetical protein